MEEFCGTEAGLSAATITRLTREWQEERERFMERDLSERDYVYVWVDGIHTGVRLGSEARLCCLVMVGVRLDGTKELVALAEGYRESEESWAELLRDLKGRGMRAPVLAVGDGALGFWAAVRDVFPHTRHQREWVHKTSNVLDSLPKSVHKRAKKAIHEITCAERTRKRLPMPSRHSPLSLERNGRRPSPRSQRRKSCCSPSMSFRPSTGYTFAHHQPDRIHVCSGQGANRRNEGARVQSGRSVYDLQTDGGGSREVA